MKVKENNEKCKSNINLIKEVKKQTRTDSGNKMNGNNLEKCVTMQQYIETAITKETTRLTKHKV